MLALAFLIGLMPGSEDARIGANSDDQVNMGALLDLMLSEKGADLAVDSSIDAVVVKTPEDNFQTPTIPVPVQAIGADVSESIRFVALDVNNEAVWAGSDPMSVSGQWTGDGSVASEEVFGPVFASAVDVGAFVTGTAGVSTTLGLYALANSISLSKQVETIMYDRASSPVNAVEITLTEVAGGATGVDSDGNAFPDNILTDIGPGEIWTANVNTTGGLRTVLIANLDTTAKGNGGPVTVSPAPGVTVTAPGTDDYPASLVGPGETVLLVAEVVGDLEALVDDVNPGGESFSDPAGWADAVDALVPSAREGLGSYIEISLVVGSGGTFSEIDSLDGTGLSVILTVEDLTVDPDSGIELLSYPTDIASDGDGITNVPGLQTWSTVAGVASTDTSLTADLTSFSVFQPVQVPDIMLTGVDPDTIPSNEQTDLTITGVVPVGMAMNMATADMYYRITVGGIDATFRDVAGVAISENMSGSNNLYVTSPALNATKQVPVDVAIFDIVADPNNPAATLTQAVQVLDTFTLDVTEGGTGSGSTMVSPGPDAPNNEYFDGTVVNLDATADAGSTFNAWTGDTANIANPASASTTITMLADASIIAQFTAGTMYGVTYNLNGDGSINISGDAPVTTSGTTRMYTDGTMLNITAVPDAGQEFVSWSGTAAAGLADATAQNIQITVNADTDLTANFQPVTGVVDLDVTIAGDGVVDVSTGVATIVPPGRTTSVFSNTNITLTADADPGAVFVGWSGTAAAGLADATDPVAVINIAGDSDITATFSTAPLTVSGLATAGGTNEAWIFGGVVARIEGTGLNAAGTPIVSFDTGAAGGAVTAIGFRAARDGSSVDVVVPASNDTSGAATVDADVTVSIAGSTSNTLSDALTYKRYDTDASGVVTTAAILDTPDSENTVQVSVNGTNTDGAAQLTLPDLSGNLPTGVDTVYLIARAASDATTTKQTTPPLTALGTQAITDALGADTAIDDITDFSLHLYAAVEVAKNTPTVGSPTLSNASGLIDFGRPVGADGVPTEGTPATLTFDVTGTGLTTSDATDSLTTWGVASEFDYVSEITTLVKGTSANTTIGYQSEVEADEYTTDGADNLTTLTSRLYSLNGFSVRQNAILPADLAASIQLNTPTGTASGSVNGGTQVEIVSPFGDLAWLDRVTFGSNVQTSFLSTAGDSEYSVSLASPASNSAGVVDVSLYGNGDPDTPLVTLQRVFEYEAEPVTLPIGLILTLLGLLVALIGLAAGGDSGGGGGGPCFIATAAYGTPMAGDIDALRAVRDDYLLTNAMGTAFVDTYYRVSPTIADAVASSPVLAAGVRVVLVPVIALSKMVIAVPMLAVLIAMSLGAIYMLRRRPRSQA
jgi:hypothetical protein